MSDKKDGTTETTALTIFDVVTSDLIDSAMEEQINESVRGVLAMDDRFINPDIETIDAIRDWVRAEAVLAMAFKNYIQDKGTSRDERMFRMAMIQKNALRDEIFGKFKGRKGKQDEVDKANRILADQGIIVAKTEVEIIDAD